MLKLFELISSINKPWKIRDSGVLPNQLQGMMDLKLMSKWKWSTKPAKCAKSKAGLWKKTNCWLLYTKNTPKNGQLSPHSWRTVTKTSAYIASGALGKMAQIGRFGPQRKTKKSKKWWKKWAKIGSCSQRWSEPRQGNRSGNASSISLTPKSRNRIGPKNRIARLLNFIAW